MNKAAGILIVTKDKRALFLKRSATAQDCSGCWDFPGGGTEADETAEQTAIRETKEEIGFLPAGDLVLHTRQQASTAAAVPAPVVAAPGPPATPPVVAGGPGMPMVDFTTFLLNVDYEFEPTLDGEHDGYAWAPVDSPPEPLHPGCRVALARLVMDELGVARAMAEGSLTSPQHYKNMVLFDLRITGTGVSYRSKLNEFVYRRPENYLTPDFLARCNGLPVILMHPTKAFLNTEEFGNRVIGTMMLPYIKGSEVWGIAKIYDIDAARVMEDGQLSTSPAVLLSNEGNTKFKLEDGSSLLIEGKPSLLDHLAICEHGVWDKGEGPNGVKSESREDSTMPTPEEEAKMKKDADEAEAKKKADAEAEEMKKKADADAGEKLDKVLTHLDSMGKRMDAFEAKEKARDDAEAKAKADAEEEARKKGDPEQIAADKAKKDADEKEASEKAEKEKKDAEEKAKADADDIRKRIADVESKLPKDVADSDANAMADAQARADAVFAEFGEHAPRPLRGEALPAYKRRMASMLKKHSATWKDVELAAIADDNAFGPIEAQIYADAQTAARNPVDLPDGQLRPVTTRDPATGMVSTKFYGRQTFIHMLKRPSRMVAHIGAQKEA